jgi:hypothetical protein
MRPTIPCTAGAFIGRLSELKHLERAVQGSDPVVTILAPLAVPAHAESAARRVAEGDVEGAKDSRESARRVAREAREHFLARPGLPLGIPQLLEATWPPSTANREVTRAYLEILRLRKLGLGPIILHSRDGYFLDPNVAIEGRAP